MIGWSFKRVRGRDPPEFGGATAAKAPESPCRMKPPKVRSRASGRRSKDGDSRADPLFRSSERFTLDERSPVPLYHQVEQIILDRIAKAGAIGLKVPREMDLIKIFNVSRATVKKATDSLAATGLIERRRSAGTRIVRLNVTEDLGRLTSFSEQMQSRNLRASTEILGVELHQPEAGVAEALHRLGPRADKPFRVVNCAELAAADQAITAGKLFGFGKGSGLTNVIKDGQPGLL